jgi:hypothetical protein
MTVIVVGSRSAIDLLASVLCSVCAGQRPFHAG